MSALEKPCVFWTKAKCRGGYGRIMYQGKVRRAHRVIYEHEVGPIPRGMDLDHICHSADATCPGGRACPHRACVEPTHLEPVTHRENILRGRSFAALKARQTACVNGHPFDERNTIWRPAGGRGCRACLYIAVAKYRARTRQELVA